MANTTLDPAHTGADFTLSGGNLTATATGGVSATTRSTTSRSSGLLYFEIHLTTEGDNSFGVGNASLSTTLNVVGNDVNISIGGRSSGAPQIFFNQATIGSWDTGTPANGTFIQVAVDITNKLLWLRDSTQGNGAFWNGNITFVPGDAHGFSFAGATGPFFACVSSNATVSAMTFNFGNTAFNQSIPSGFSAWDNQPTFVYAPAKWSQTRFRPRKHFRRTPQFRPRHIYVVPFRLPQTPVNAMALKRLRPADRKSRNRKFFRPAYRPRHIIFPPKKPVSVIPQLVASFAKRYARRKAHGFFKRQFRPRHIFGLAHVVVGPARVGVWAAVPGLGVESQRLSQPILVNERTIQPKLYQASVAAPELYTTGTPDANI